MMKKILINLLKAVGTAIGLWVLFLLGLMYAARFDKPSAFKSEFPFYILTIVVFYLFYSKIDKLKLKARCEGQDINREEWVSFCEEHEELK